MRLTRILVPLDLTEDSERALPCALVMQQALGGAIVTAHFAPGGLSPSGQKALHALRGRLHPLEVDTVVEAVEPVAGIVEMARREPFDLVVMATRDRSPLARAVLGTVTEAVVRQAPCPVLVTRRVMPERPAIRRILCPTDFSPLSRVAAAYAGELAGAFGATLHLLHVREDMASSTAPECTAGDAQEAEIRDLHARLKDVGVRLPGVRVGFSLTEGAPVACILACARVHGADLIVMATHGRTGLARLMMGSITEGVLRDAACPVLTLRGSVGDAALLDREITRASIPR